jgi:hypothetical protein
MTVRKPSILVPRHCHGTGEFLFVFTGRPDKADTAICLFIQGCISIALTFAPWISSVRKHVSPRLVGERPAAPPAVGLVANVRGLTNDSMTVAQIPPESRAATGESGAAARTKLAAQVEAAQPDEARMQHFTEVP